MDQADHSPDDPAPTGGVRSAGAPAPASATVNYAELYERLVAKHQQEMGELQYVISHDLQEPLRKITGFVGLLTRRYTGQLDQDADEYMEFINESTDRMQQLIKDLLRLSRVETRGAAFDAVATGTLVDQVTDELRAALPDCRLEFEISDELPTVDADSTQLRNVFRQLLDNAAKFHRDQPPRIRIAADRRARGWHFQVADNGIGIEECYADKIFGIFQRLHTREEYPGTGIGLALCRKIIERHGGKIWVESTPDQGATFHFTIPDQKAELNHVSA